MVSKSCQQGAACVTHLPAEGIHQFVRISLVLVRNEAAYLCNRPQNSMSTRRKLLQVDINFHRHASLHATSACSTVGTPAD